MIYISGFNRLNEQKIQFAFEKCTAHTTILKQIRMLDFLGPLSVICVVHCMKFMSMTITQYQTQQDDSRLI